MRRLRVEYLPASTGCPLHGDDGPCPEGCKLADTPSDLHEGGHFVRGVRVAARPCGHEDGANDPAVTERNDG